MEMWSNYVKKADKIIEILEIGTNFKSAENVENLLTNIFNLDKR